MSENRNFYYCDDLGDYLWRVSWVEHGSFHVEYIVRQKKPKFETFADLKKTKWASRRKALALKGITLKSKK